MKIVILYSGGLDSFIMLKLAQVKHPNAETILVHYDIGQEYSKKELDAINKSKEHVEIKKVDWINDKFVAGSKAGNNSGSIWIPGRNLVLASLAASAFLPDEVWMGGLKGEDHKSATDKNKKFIDLTNQAWEYIYSPFSPVPKLVFPLINENWGKFEAVEWVYKNGHGTKEDILETSSCLSDSETKNCGKCVVCCRRKYIFMQLGFFEEYEINPLKGESNLKMMIEMLKTPEGTPDDGVHYDHWRRREILPGLYLEFGTTNHEELIDELTYILESL